MKNIKTWYNPAQKETKSTSSISMISLFSWLSVLIVIVVFWTAVAVGYKRDYVPRAIAKMENRKDKFLANHKAIQKKISGIRGLV